MKLALTYDDVALVPQYNNVLSRTDPNLSTYLTKNTAISIPIVNANMDTVISQDLAAVLVGLGTVPIFHRFFKNEGDQTTFVRRFPSFISSGTKDYENFYVMIQHLMGVVGNDNFKGVCFDIAHGHSKDMLNFVSKFKEDFPFLDAIGGNVCTAQGYQDLVNAGCDAVKVGVGGGAVCTTRIKTGCGVPQFTAVQECAEVAKRLRIPVIADGGVRGSADIVKALAAGACSVMVGRLLVDTFESSAPKKKRWGKIRAKYRGQASEDFQKDFYGKLKKGTTAEGVDFWVPVKHSAKEVIDDLLGGVRSGMTYMGSSSIKELQRKAEFVQVTPAYITESHPRP